MAVVALTAQLGTSQGLVIEGLLTFISERYALPAQDLLPNGPAWPRASDAFLTLLVRAASYGFARLERRAQNFVNKEAHPNKTLEMLPDWEEALGIEASGTVAERRAAVVAKLIGLGPTPAARPALLALAASFGYDLVGVRTYTPLTVGQGCGQEDYNTGWRFRADYVVYSLGVGIDAAFKAALAQRGQEHTILGVMNAWSQWVGKSMPTAFTIQGGFTVKPMGTAPGGVVVVGNSANVWFTPNGRIWKQVTSAAGYAGLFEGGCQRDDGVVVLIGQNEIQHKALADSTFTRHSVTGLHDCIATDGVNFVIGSSGGRIFTSPDGNTWTQRTPDASYVGTFGSIAWNAKRGLWIIGGTSGEIQTSPDGITWTRVANGGSNNYVAVTVLASGETIFTANNTGFVRVSPTGVVTGTFTITGITNLTDVKLSQDGGCLIGVGATSGVGKVAKSRDDGATWSLCTADNSQNSVQELFLGPVTTPIMLASNGQGYYLGSYNGLENVV